MIYHVEEVEKEEQEVEVEAEAVPGARKSGGGWGLFGSFISTFSDVNKTLSFQAEAQSTHPREGRTYMRVFVRRGTPVWN